MSFQAPNVGNYSGQGGLLPFLSSLLGGVHQTNEATNAKKQQDTENQFKKQQMALEGKKTDLETQQLQNTIGQQQRTQQQGQLDQMNKMFSENPQYAKDPAIVAKWNDLSNSLGLPAPRKADGTPNVDALKPQFSSLSVADQQRIMEMPQAQRAVLLNNYGNVPKTAYKTDAYVTAKDQAAISKIHIQGNHEEAWEAATQKGLAIRTQLASARTGLMSAEEASLGARAQLATVTAAAIPKRLQLEGQRIQIEGQRVQGYLQSVQQRGDKNSLTQLATANRALTGAITDAQRSYEKAVNDYNTQIANGADPADPGVTAAADAMNQAHVQLKQVQQYGQQANALLGSTATYAKNMAAQTGNPTTVTKVGLGKTFKASDGFVWVQKGPNDWESTGKKWK